MLKRTLLILTLFGTAAYAQTGPVGPLRTQGVGIDNNNTCWVQGPANVLKQCTPTLGAPTTVTATTVLATGTWVVVNSATGATTTVVSDGTTLAGAAGFAYQL